MIRRLLPTLAIYFITGFSGFTFLVYMYLKKDFFNFTSDQYTAAAIWASLPWTIKILFSSVIDSVYVLNRNRSPYIFLAGLLLVIGNIIHLINITGIPSINLLCVESLIISSGIVVADIIADTLAVESVPDLNPQDLAQSAMYSRIAQIVGGLLGSLIALSVKNMFTPVQAYSIWFIVPVMFFVAGFFVWDFKKPKEIV